MYYATLLYMSAVMHQFNNHRHIRCKTQAWTYSQLAAHVHLPSYLLLTTQASDLFRHSSVSNHHVKPHIKIYAADPNSFKACRGDWNYLTVQLARTSEDEDGDPDLYGLFTGGTSGQVLGC